MEGTDRDNAVQEAVGHAESQPTSPTDVPSNALTTW
jgi:hypothetical protein